MGKVRKFKQRGEFYDKKDVRRVFQRVKEYDVREVIMVALLTR